MIFVGAGTYTVTVTDANECSQTGSATVTNTPGPVLDSVVVTLETCIGESDALITVYANSGIPPYTYTWDDPSLGTTSTSQNVASGVYYLIVTDAQFCGTADTITVSPGLTDCEVEESLNIPSSFTPNFDLTNDTWILRGISKYPNVTVEIYNRWGSLLYSSGGYAEPWDGTYQGKEVASATYYYIIILSENDEPITGSVTVVR
jgi:gliding motility-associated-like protein